MLQALYVYCLKTFINTKYHALDVLSTVIITISALIENINGNAVTLTW